MKVRRKMIKAIVVIGFLILIAPIFATAQGLTLRVNCDRGQSVQRVLDRLDRFNVPATIVVTGTCKEHIVITEDDITLKGGIYVGFDPNQNTIQVQGARRVLITGATVGGARHGVVAYQGGSVTVESSTIQDNAKGGIVANLGSSVVVNGCTIRNNNYWGAAAMDNSALIVVNSTITSNGRSGVSVSAGSSGRIGEDSRGDAGPNTIQNNSSGISVYQASQARIANNTIQNNTWQGVFVEGASARLTNNTIRSNYKGVEVNSSGSARLGINDDGSAGVGNIIESNQLDGISISHSGSAYMLNNTMRLNGLGTGRPGVKVYQATGRLVGSNTIEGNGGHGVEVDLGALFQGVGDWNLTPGPDLITGNGYSGISGWNGASLDIRHATVTNNTQNGIVLSLQSTLRIYDSTVSGNSWDGIRLYDGSSVARYLTNTPRDIITGNTGWGIICYGGSTLVGGTGDSGVSSNLGGQVNCPPIIFP